MEIKNRKEQSIFKLFLVHIIRLMLAIILFICITIIGVSESLRLGIVLKANYIEEQLLKVEEEISYSFNESLLPEHCQYIYIDANGDLIDTNMDEKSIEKMRKYLSKGQKAYYDFYKDIMVQDGSIVIVKYSMLAHFSNPTLNKIIPFPEAAVIVILFTFIVLSTIFTAMTFSKKLKANLISINTATKKIENQDLNFEIEPTQIKEFNASLMAIDKLKEALTISLNSQWNDEQQKKTQISALAHDIKTPLTIIRGNAELLLEEEDTKENKDLITYIKTSSIIIENYLELLMEAVNKEHLSFQRNLMDKKELLEVIEATAVPLCKTKNIAFYIKDNSKSEAINIDDTLFVRAIINVIDNAVRYSEHNSYIGMWVSENNSYFIFEIIDSGKGFSEEALKKATQEFYTEDTSRTNHNYGLGLHFTKNVVEMHCGKIEISNCKNETGAAVSLYIKK